MVSKFPLGSWLEGQNCLKTEKIIEAFNKIDRADFVLPQFRDQAYEDYPLPIGFEQTISQPSTVAFMFELLEPRDGEKILDVGAGSGWTTALLSQLVGGKGEVIGVEAIPELAEYGQRNLMKYPDLSAEIVCVDELGYPKEAPFDRILVSASASQIPEALVGQLRTGGTMIVPVRFSIYEVKKKGEGKIDTTEYPGFSFVPLK